MKYFFLLASLISLLFLSSCGREETPSARVYTGEDLFRGIYFQQGEVAQKISESFTLKPSYLDLLDDDKSKAKVQLLQNDIVTTIKVKHPDFFDDFAKKMQSGDHLEILNTLNKGTDVLQNTVINLPEITAIKSELEKSQDLVKDVDVSKFIVNNKLDKDALESYIKEKIKSLNNQKDMASLSGARKLCIAINAAIVLNVAVLVNAAAGVNVVFAINGAFGVNLAAAWNIKFSVPRYDQYRLAASDNGEAKLLLETTSDIIARNLCVK